MNLMQVWIFILILFCVGGCSSCKYDHSHNNTQDNILQNLSDKKIEIIAPGSSCDSDTLRRLRSIISHNCNMRTINSPHSTIDQIEYNDSSDVERSMHSDYDVIRAQNLKQALLDGVAGNINVVWALRGGHGTAKVVEMLYADPTFIEQMKKINARYPVVVGYCDITALHIFLSQEFGWKTIHGPVFMEILSSKKSANNMGLLSRVINHWNTINITVADLTPLNSAALISKNIHGRLIGGNLSIVQTSIGTKWQIKTEGKILFLEDVHIKPYQIDRMLYHMLNAGLITKANGIIFGSFNGDSDQLTLRILKAFASKLDIPVYHTNVFGHGYRNYPIVVNAAAEIYSDINNVKYFKQNLAN